jgi:hypothetical protein
MALYVMIVLFALFAGYFIYTFGKFADMIEYKLDTIIKLIKDTK